MTDPLLFFYFLIGLIIVSLIICARIVWLAISLWRAKIAASAKVPHKKPSVTVLFYVDRDNPNTATALTDIMHNDYRKFDVVMVDNRARRTPIDGLEKLKAKYHRDLQILRRRHTGPIQKALRAGYRKSQHGKIVIVICTDMMIDRSLISRAVRMPNATARIGAPNSLKQNPSLSGIARTSELIYQQTREFAYLFTARQLRSVRLARQLFMLKHQRALRHSVVLVAIALLLLCGLLFFSGIAFLWYAWLLLAFYGTLIIWLEYERSARERLVLTLCLPVLPFMIIALAGIEITSGVFRKMSYM